MGNWYKESKELHPLIEHIDNFDDRNVINGKIRELKGLAVKLKRVSDGGYQDVQESRQIISTLLANKTLSSYHKILDLLRAAHGVSLDNHAKMMSLCGEAMEEVYAIVKRMEEARQEFVEKTLPQRMKE